LFKQYLELRQNKTGVFTTVDIPAKSPVIEITGNIYNYETVDHNHPATIQIGINKYIGPSGDIDDYINHNCDPNCFLQCVGNRAILYSIYDIASGSEITFDYCTSSTDTHELWSMNCNCKSVKCRKIISGFQYLPLNLVEQYKKQGIVPLFLRNSIFSKQ
jgi:hypothetical protein